MKLKWFPLGLKVRDVYAQPALLFLGLLAVVALSVMTGGFSMSDAGLQGPEMLFASMLPAVSFKKAPESLEQLEAIAYRDSLTGLRNRRGLWDDIEALQAGEFLRDKRAALLLIDLDRFKFINDTLGHDAGDQMLISLSERLIGLCDGDKYCYRLGGDEFLIVWNGGPSFIDVDVFCSKLKDALNHPYKIDRSHVEGGGSIGITWEREGDKDVGSMLKRADMALYKAKSVAGSSHRFFCGQMEEETRRRRQLEVELRNLIIASDFKLQYVPTAYASDLTVSHIAVDVSGLKTQFGSLSDQQHVDALIETGLIVQLDRAVLERAFSDISIWNNRYTVIIELHSNQLLDPTFLTYFTELLEEYRISGNKLILAFDTLDKPENRKLVNASLDGLKGLGVRIASHGFGGDISNFSAGLMPQNRYLILGKKWVENIAHDETASELLNNLIRLAACMNLNIILDGVEYADQVQCLAQHSGLLIKGDLVGKPIPASEV